MTDQTPVDPDHQPRIPGVRYRPVTRFRLETTTINGVAETEEVPYTAWEPVPPRDWDGLILRGATCVAVGVSLIAVTSTAASVGGLLDKLILAPIAYGVACIFSVSWLVCQALEYVARLEPERARKARRAGWLFLLVSMGAVVAFGVDKGEPIAGGVGAVVDLIAKGLCVLVLEQHAVPLSRGVSHWLRRRKEKITADAAVTGHRQRLDRTAAYNRAVYGASELAATEAITSVVEAPVLQPGPAVSGQGTLLSGQPVSVPAAPAAPAPVPAPAPAVIAPSYLPVSPPAAPLAPPVPPVASPQPQPVPARPAPEPEPEEPAAVDESKLEPTPLRAGIAQTVRDITTKTPTISDADLVVEVRAIVGDRPQLADTVVRTRRREDKKKAAS
ncbi:hypothetical protein [Streptomyces sp. NPDC007346]|uniref:hypothetical protein n=1 Tax=Streptomyces sp. NPDC007346 TaxID=3154682 RepID=UPI003452E896